MQKLLLQFYWLQGKSLLCSAPSHPNGILFIIQLLEVSLHSPVQSWGGTPLSMSNSLSYTPPNIPVPPPVNVAG